MAPCGQHSDAPSGATTINLHTDPSGIITDGHLQQRERERERERESLSKVSCPGFTTRD